MATVLSLVQSACYEAQIDAPSTLVSLTNLSELQLLNLFYATGRDLRQANCWPQLKRQHTIYLQAGRSQYPLPNDFYAALPNTHWDQQNHWAMRGPMGDAGYNYRRYGYVTVENRKAYRVFGPDLASAANAGAGGQVMIDPVPGASSAGQAITFEYMSKSWLMPPAWGTGVDYTSSTSYVNVNGKNYRSATTASAGANPPVVGFNGVGQDGGVFWKVLSTSAWAGSTLYAPDEYVTNGGNLYVCTTGGTSASSGGPTGTGSTTISDGTAAWSYCASSSWTGQTVFSAGSFIKISSTYYKSVTPPNTLNSSQVTGKIQPNWSIISGPPYVWGQSDGTVTWHYYSDPYETVIANTDVCLFDEDLMILGLKWRFLQAKRETFEDFQAEYESKKKTAVARWNAGQRIDLAAGGISQAVNVGEGSFGL